MADTSTEARTIVAIGTRVTMALGSVPPATITYVPQANVKDFSSFRLYAYNTHAGGTANPVSLEFDATVDGSRWVNLGSVDKLQGTSVSGTYVPSSPVTSPYYSVRVGIWSSEGTALAGSANLYLMGRR